MQFAGLPGAPSLGSDNHSGVHPEVMAAMVAANQGHAPAYGTDVVCARAEEIFRQHFGDVEVFFVFNGTAANVLSLRSMMPSHAAVLCADTAHIHVDECAAPERQIGCKVQALPSHAGKLRPEDVQKRFIRGGDQHFAGPRVLSLTQSTEVGTVYTVDELRALTELCHANGVLVHMDGSRLVNAAASLDLSLRQLTADVGIDVLSFGGTKNGMMFGEAVVFFRRDLAHDFKFMRKQFMQLGSKMRFVAAQFCAMLESDLWLRNARHANAMAQHLAQQVRSVAGVTVTQEVQANVVFATVPQGWVKRLREHSFFYVWDEHRFEVRWMTTFDTEPTQIDSFCTLLHTLAAE